MLLVYIFFGRSSELDTGGNPREDLELGNLPVEQQLRMAARRINRRIDFDELVRTCEFPAKESGANKRTAGEREDDDDDGKGSIPPAKGDQRKPALKAKRSNAQVNSGRGGGDESPPSSGSFEGSGSENSPRGSSDGSDSGGVSDDDEKNSDSAGSEFGTNSCCASSSDSAHLKSWPLP
jgi:hypothetical protein